MKNYFEKFLFWLLDTRVYDMLRCRDQVIRSWACNSDRLVNDLLLLVMDGTDPAVVGRFDRTIVELIDQCNPGPFVLTNLLWGPLEGSSWLEQDSGLEINSSEYMQVNREIERILKQVSNALGNGKYVTVAEFLPIFADPIPRASARGRVRRKK